MLNFPEYIKSHHNIKGVFWDFDGTLVDSHRKNYTVTKRIVNVVTGQSWKNFSALESSVTYRQKLRISSNWREFYRMEFGLTEEQTDYAGSLWTDHQLNDDTAAPVFQGISRILEKFKHIPHGIISQNSRKLIEKILHENNLGHYFDFIIGHEEVGLRNQKPDPAGLLLAIEKRQPVPEEGYFYIGDHETDIEFAYNANRLLNTDHSGRKILTIAACYQADSDPAQWSHQPDFRAFSVAELESIFDKYLAESPRS